MVTFARRGVLTSRDLPHPHPRPSPRPCCRCHDRGPLSSSRLRSSSPWMVLVAVVDARDVLSCVVDIDGTVDGMDVVHKG